MPDQKRNQGKKKGGGQSKAAKGGAKKSAVSEQPEDHMIRQEVILWIVLAVSVVLFVSNFGIGGKVGNALSGVLFGLFGLLAYFVPVFLFIGTVFVISNGKKRAAVVKVVAAVLFLCFLCFFLELLTGDKEDYSPLKSYMYGSAEQAGGGFFGGLFAWLICPNFGRVSAYVIDIVMLVVTMVVMTERSAWRHVQKGGRRVYESAREGNERFREIQGQRREERKMRRMERKAVGVSSDTKLLPDGERGPSDGLVEITEKNYGKTMRARMPKDGYGAPEGAPSPDRTDAPYGDDLPWQPQDTPAPIDAEPGVAELGAAEPRVTERREVSLSPAGPPSEDGEAPEAGRESDMPLFSPELQKLFAQTDESSEDGNALPDTQGEPEDSACNEGMTDAYENESAPEDGAYPGTGIARFQDTRRDVDMPGYADDGEFDEGGFDEGAADDAEPARDVSDDEVDAILADISAEFRTDYAGLQDGPAIAGDDVMHGSNGPGHAAGDDGMRGNPDGSAEEYAMPGDAGAEAISAAAPEPRPYVFPPTDLLKKGDPDRQGDSVQHLQQTALKLQQTLKNFGVNVTISNVSRGPTVTRYEIQPEMGVKVSKIVNLTDDIKLNLAAADIRMEAPIPGKAAIGIEVPNKEVLPVMLRDLIESEEFAQHPSNIAFAVGRDIGGNVVMGDIAKMPHLLIAGATGSGKSVCINTIIMSLLYRADPNDVKLILIDPKVVELSIYNGIPHLFIPVVTDPKKAAGALNWAVAEMTERYQLFAAYGVRDLKGYNAKVDALPDRDAAERQGIKRLPQIVIIVDELADLMMVAPGDVEDAICRLAQLARACGIHLIIATQRPSVNVITGLIKANMPSRIAFSVTSGVDSRTILDMVGAEKLLGKGDMLYYPQGLNKPLRVQGAFVSDEEVSDVVDFIKENSGSASYDGAAEQRMNEIAVNSAGSGGSASSQTADNGRDAYFADAAKLLIDKDKASIGMLQRYFKIGFNRAARIMDQLEEAGVVGPEEGTKPRQILMSPEAFESMMEDGSF